MSIRSLITLWCLTTSMWSSATAVEINAGPWWQLASDGGLRLVVELDEQLSDSATASAMLTADEETYGLPRMQQVQRPVHDPSHLAVWDLPAALASGTKLHVDLGRHRLQVQVPARLPQGDRDARLMVIGGNGYPDAAAITAMEQQLGGPLDAVFAMVGRGLARRIGRGGWEERIPMVLVGHTPEALVPLFGQHAVVSGTVGLGRLGLTIVDDATTAVLDLARDLRPVRLLLSARQLWDLKNKPTRELIRLIELANKHHVPCLIGSNTQGTFLSDPLVTLDIDTISPAAGGCRYLALDTQAGDLANIPATMSRQLPDALVLGLATQGRDLQFVYRGAGSQEAQVLPVPAWPDNPHPQLPFDRPLQLASALQIWRQRGTLALESGRHVSWVRLQDLAKRRHAGEDIARLLTGFQRGLPLYQDISRELDVAYPWPVDGLAEPRFWGVGDGVALAASWRELEVPKGRAPAELEKVQATEYLSWLPAPVLKKSVHAEVVRERLFNAARDMEQTDLLHRLLGLYPLAGCGWLVQNEAVPGSWQRWAVLRHLDAGNPVDEQYFRHVIPRLHDPALLRTLVASLKGRTDWRLLVLLRKRWEAQARGDLPLDTDPVLQHRLAAAVFSSPYLSPTGLRKLAVQLEDRLTPLGRAPVERFLERHGRRRAPP